jgi:hypothetical protein
MKLSLEIIMQWWIIYLAFLGHDGERVSVSGDDDDGTQVTTYLKHVSNTQSLNMMWT